MYMYVDCAHPTRDFQDLAYSVRRDYQGFSSHIMALQISVHLSKLELLSIQVLSINAHLIPSIDPQMGHQS